MKAIIIQDSDAKALLDKLELKSMQVNNMHAGKPPTVEDMHRYFHYVVCGWLQEQGADVTSRTY